MEIEIGDRVLASVGGTGSIKRGKVTTVVTAPGIPQTTMVHFDGDHGHSGPCHVVAKIKE